MPTRGQRVRLHSKRGRRPSSARWLEQQINDRFVQSARAEGYRSRAAYKLLEIDRRHRLLSTGRRVLDLGSAPGGWLQVAAAARCRVVGIDLLPIAPIEGALALEGDLLEAATIDRLLAATDGPVELLLSDLAAPAIGQRTVDRLRAEALVEAVLDLLPTLLAPGGRALIKLLRGVEGTVTDQAKPRFQRIQLIRPEASRRGSTEIYLLGTGFKAAPDRR
jgi:23S rRNA (uridine2552-2'-O)-methyltransferase